MNPHIIAPQSPRVCSSVLQGSRPRQRRVLITEEDASTALSGRWQMVHGPLEALICQDLTPGKASERGVVVPSPHSKDVHMGAAGCSGCRPETIPEMSQYNVLILPSGRHPNCMVAWPIQERSSLIVAPPYLSDIPWNRSRKYCAILRPAELIPASALLENKNDISAIRACFCGGVFRRF
jgi:hypothetical protein